MNARMSLQSSDVQIILPQINLVLIEHHCSDTRKPSRDKPENLNCGTVVSIAPINEAIKSTLSTLGGDLTRSKFLSIWGDGEVSPLPFGAGWHL